MSRTREILLEEAIAECERWLKRCDFQREKAEALLKLASERRAGKVSAAEAKSRMDAIDGRAPTVFDGSDLEAAVRILLDHVKTGQKEPK